MFLKHGTELSLQAGNLTCKIEPADLHMQDSKTEFAANLNVTLYCTLIKYLAYLGPGKTFIFTIFLNPLQRTEVKQTGGKYRCDVGVLNY